MAKLNYESAMEELEQIVSALETGNIPVDELSKKVKRAAELMRVCKSVLYKTEEEVNKILTDLEDDKPKEG